MRIEYSNTALEMMRERNIQPAEVEYCLRNYNTAYPNRHGNRIIHKCFVEGRLIKVKIIANMNPLVVTTVSDSE